MRRESTIVISALLFILQGLSISLRAQEAPQSPSSHPSKDVELESRPSTDGGHGFWDKKNAELFLGVAGARALDYASSRHFRGKEINERLLSNGMVDNRPLFVAVEAAGVAASIGVAYLFHRTGHHKLERWVSVIHISVGVGGSVRNYLLKPDAPPAVQQ